MPAADALLDSNVLVYALSDRPSERRKREQARRLIAGCDFGLSYQVLMETWVMATRRMKPVLPETLVAEFIDGLLAFPCVPCTEGLYRQAVDISVRHRVHPYDAAILAAAQELGADTVYSEDFAHGRSYDGVRVLNPFQGTN